MKNKITAALLAFFLGGIGIHEFYLGEKSNGIGYLGANCTAFLLILIGLFIEFVLVSSFGITFIGLGIVLYAAIGISAFVDFIKLLIMDDNTFNLKYNQA